MGRSAAGATTGFGALGHGLGDGHHIGDDETAADAVPLRFPGRVADIVAGYFFTCALLEEGEVYCWGLPDRGTLGYGNEERIGDDETAASAGPVSVGGPAEALFAGDDATCAVLRSGPLSCWGSRTYLPFNPEHIGDDETPADMGSGAGFPGPGSGLPDRRHRGRPPAGLGTRRAARTPQARRFLRRGARRRGAT